MACINDVSALFWQHPLQWSTQSSGAGTIAAGLITGAPIVVLNSSAATPGTQTTRTAAQLLADYPSMHAGYTWLLFIINSVTTNTLTLAAGNGVTLAGSAQTALAFSGRAWSCTVTNFTTPAITMTALFGFGTVGGTSFSTVA